VTGSSTGMVMVISGKICAKYVARLAQSDAIPWSIKLVTPKKTASDKRVVSAIKVATFYRSFERNTTSEADSAAKSLARSFLAFLLARSP